MKKDTKYAFTLFLSFGKIEQASKIALAIVKTEMDEGKYRESFQILFQMCSEILERKSNISYEMIQKIIIVHSYSIVKKIIKAKDHYNATKLLDRV